MRRPYSDIEFPETSSGRPFVFVNMVATVDGKTLTGARDEHVMDLGSEVDHQCLRDLESHAHAVLVGAETVRATKKIWYPEHLLRFVATRSGRLPWHSRFFVDGPDSAFIVAPPNASVEVPDPAIRVCRLGANGEFAPVLEEMYGLGIRVLAVEGGSELNAALIQEDLVDEYFLTIAPKLKLGRGTPTYAGGEPLAREDLRRLRLVSSFVIEDEVFLRYGRAD